MGAGSAKGINSSPDDDGDAGNDTFSVNSQDSPVSRSKTPMPIINKDKKRLSALNGSLDLSDTEENPSSSIPPPPPPLPSDKSLMPKEDKKKGGIFGFSRKKDEEETSAFIHEDSETKVSKTDPKKEKGFKLFNWKKDSKKQDEKDENLDQEINDLNKTFDSLGIEGKKNSWDGQKDAQPKSQSADDIRKLSPMRNRVHIKPRPIRTSHSRRATETFGSVLVNSKRNFKYSWETENNSAPPQDEDQWSYKAVVIDGFDIEKFKRANYEDSTIDSRIPNSIGDNSSPPPHRSTSGLESPLTYDPMEQKILSTIERDFGY